MAMAVLLIFFPVSTFHSFNPSNVLIRLHNMG